MAYDAALNAVAGLDPFRQLLEGDDAETVLVFLKRELQSLPGQERAGVAFVLAECHRRKGDVQGLRRLFENDDADIKASVLNALWEPGPTPEMAACIMALAVEAVRHPSPAVRAEACSVFMNQCAFVDVSDATDHLASLLGDGVANVRMQAAYAAGNLAKHKFDVSKLVAPLATTVGDADRFVRNAGAWALWQLSRFKRDIGHAIPELVRFLVTDEDDWDEPRTNVTGALLHHAKTSVAATRRVRECVLATPPPGTAKTVKRFLVHLGALK